MLNYQAPKPYHTITPFLSVDDVAATKEFLIKAFNAKIKEELIDDDGNLRHVEVWVGDSLIMMGQARSPEDKTSGMLYIYVSDADEQYQKALDAGATSIMPPEDQFYGDRNAGVRDSEGNSYWIAQRKEDLSGEEIQARVDATGWERDQ